MVNKTVTPNPACRDGSESREAALSQVERVTEKFQKKAGKRAVDEADTCSKVERDTARYEALAREHGADMSEEAFNEALTKVGRAKPA